MLLASRASDDEERSQRLAGVVPRKPQKIKLNKQSGLAEVGAAFYFSRGLASLLSNHTVFEKSGAAGKVISLASVKSTTRIIEPIEVICGD